MVDAGEGKEGEGGTLIFFRFLIKPIINYSPKFYRIQLKGFHEL